MSTGKNCFNLKTLYHVKPAQQRIKIILFVTIISLSDNFLFSIFWFLKSCIYTWFCTFIKSASLFPKRFCFPPNYTFSFGRAEFSVPAKTVSTLFFYFLELEFFLCFEFAVYN